MYNDGMGYLVIGDYQVTIESFSKAVGVLSRSSDLTEAQAYHTLIKGARALPWAIMTWQSKTTTYLPHYRAPKSLISQVAVSCIIIDRNEADDGKAKSVNQSDSRQYLGDFCSFVEIYPKI